MALFQPTAIFPDLRNGLGGGTVDASADLTVSWRVNGGSALTAFSIAIYQNDTESTPLYDTGRLSDGCPFFGTTSAGELRLFSHTVPAGALAGAGIVNGGEYKLVITQWWSETENVAQSSASAFITRAAPTLAIAEIGTIGTRYHTFTGIYDQAQGDVLNWFRWRLAYAGDTDAPFFDSGNISGTMDISAYYDGFFAGTEYAARLTVQTENGVEADTGWVPFSVAYDTMIIAGGVAAQRACGTNAVEVDWSGITYIPGAADGEYGIADGRLTLRAGASVTWDRVNYNAMFFPLFWSVLWRGTLGNEDAVCFTIGQKGGDITLFYDSAERTLTLAKAGVALAAQAGVVNLPTVTAALTPGALYLRIEYRRGGLYPSEIRMPSETLYPRADTESVVNVFQFSVDYGQEEITSVVLCGAQVCDFLEILKGAASAGVLESAIRSGGYVPENDGRDWFLADFTNGLNAGNLNIGDEALTGYAIYRRQGTVGVLVHIADVGEMVTRIFDYGAASQQGPYTYYVFPVGAKTYIAQPVFSNEIKPCFWDWSLMECSATGDKMIFSVLAEYRFGKNLSTGAMSNNNAPNVMQNFTPYPTVFPAPQNYRSGTLRSLIGGVDCADGGARYADTLALRDAIFALSLSRNALFLKNRKGDLLRVRIGAPVTMDTMDESREQAQTVALSWVEVGSAEGVSLISEDSFGTGASAPVFEGQVKTAVPSTQLQEITPDSARGYSYLSQVTVYPVPFQEVRNAAGTGARIGFTGED